MSDAPSSNLWLFLEVLARRRGLILWFTIIVTLIAVAVSLVLPKYYRAEALLLPPKDTSLPVAGLGQISEIVSVTKGLNLPVMVTASDVYTRILKSRRIVSTAIEKHDLMSHLELESFDEAYEYMLARAEFLVTEEGLLRITFEDKDGRLAADVVNTFVDELDQLNREIEVDRAHQNRTFVQERLEQVNNELDSARAEFQAFQVANKAVDFDQQTRLAIEQAVGLRVKLADVDIDIALLSKRLSSDNAELQELRRERRIIAGELTALEEQNRDSSFFSLPIAAIPRLRGEYEELYSRVRVNEALYETLLSQLEQAKIQENEELSTITVLDRATAPSMRSRPQRTLIVLGAFFAALMISIALAAALEYLNRLNESRQEDYRRAIMFVDAYLGWLPGIKPNKKKPSTL